MKELEFMEKINDINPELLEDRPIVKNRTGVSVARRILIAAAAVLLLAGTAFGVSRVIRMNRVEGPDESGYEAKIELPLVPWSSFEGEIRNVGEAIVQQQENYVPDPVFSSVLTDPGTYEQRFDSLDEAAAFIGLPGFRTPTFPYEEYECAVTAHGDEAGRVDEVRLTAEHIVPTDICAAQTVTILTDNAKESEFVSGSVWTYEFPRDVEFLHYTTPGGNDCAIAVLKPEFDSNYMSLDGCVAVGSALYEMTLSAVPQGEYDRAMEILHAWADALD